MSAPTPSLAIDPLWNAESDQEVEPFGKDEIGFYQCDHLGTPQELTDNEGKVAWSAQHKAWGAAKQTISEAGFKAGMRNPIRFQGQYQTKKVDCTTTDIVTTILTLGGTFLKIQLDWLEEFTIKLIPEIPSHGLIHWVFQLKLSKQHRRKQRA